MKTIVFHRPGWAIVGMLSILTDLWKWYDLGNVGSPNLPLLMKRKQGNLHCDYDLNLILVHLLNPRNSKTITIYFEEYDKVTSKYFYDIIINSCTQSMVVGH